MKIILLILTCFFLFSCDQEEDQILAISVLADRTDSLTIKQPDVFTIKMLCDLHSNKEKGIVFRYQNIGDTDYNPVYFSKLKPFNVLDNKIRRKSEVRKFLNVIDTLLLKENQRAYAYQRSSILIPLTQQLNTIANTTATAKKVLLFSDTFEHGEAMFNAYDTAAIDQLSQSPRLVANKLRDKLDLQDYSGISLYIYYHPKTQEDNLRFRLFNDLYRELFSGTNLDIHIGIQQNLKQ